MLSVVADFLWLKCVGPHVPPGRMTDTANGAAFDFNVLIVIALPVMIAIWVYLLYALLVWRAGHGGPEPVAGPVVARSPRTADRIGSRSRR